jgi:hypothetical protein
MATFFARENNLSMVELEKMLQIAGEEIAKENQEEVKS